MPTVVEFRNALLLGSGVWSFDNFVYFRLKYDYFKIYSYILVFPVILILTKVSLLSRKNCRLMTVLFYFLGIVNALHNNDVSMISFI